jgi:tRNA pseudouridine55 synthase
LARRGEAVELPASWVNVEAITLCEWAPPAAKLELTVGQGTYIRAIARDLGEKLGLPAHCAELRRHAIGRFQVSHALDPRHVTADDVLSMSELVAHLPSQRLTEDDVREVRFGREVAQQNMVDGFGALLADDGRLVAVAEGRNAQWHPTVVMETPS